MDNIWDRRPSPSRSTVYEQMPTHGELFIQMIASGARLEVKEDKIIVTFHDQALANLASVKLWAAIEEVRKSL